MMKWDWRSIRERKLAKLKKQARAEPPAPRRERVLIEVTNGRRKVARQRAVE